MAKVTVTKPDGQRFEISDLTFEEVKELVCTNGHKSTRATFSRRQGVSLKPADFVPDYPGFRKALTPKAKAFLAILRQHPTGISADNIADQLGFKSTTQIGGMTGGGMGKVAPQFGVELKNVYSKDIKFENGQRTVVYRPGKDIGLLQ